jgi:hypothetical protein
MEGWRAKRRFQVFFTPHFASLAHGYRECFSFRHALSKYSGNSSFSHAFQRPRATLQNSLDFRAAPKWDARQSLDATEH